MTIQVYVDGDPIVYRTGYASESFTYECIFEDDLGEMHQEMFRSGAEKKEYVKAHQELEVVDQFKHVKPEPLEHCLQSVKRTMYAIKRAIEDKYGETAELNTYLSGPGNFRIDLATLKPYKGNRKADKPYHYQSIRDYLYTRFDAEIVHGREADDEISIRARLDPKGVTATIDKDLDQIPGRHYNYDLKTHYIMSPWESMRFFYIQALCGDSGDNIGGCFRRGPDATPKLVDTWIEDWFQSAGHESMSQAEITDKMERHLWAKIVAEYANSPDRETAKLICTYKDEMAKLGPEAIAIECARLVKMQDYAGQLWNPPGLMDDLIEENFNE